MKSTDQDDRSALRSFNRPLNYHDTLIEVADRPWVPARTSASWTTRAPKRSRRFAPAER